MLRLRTECKANTSFVADDVCGAKKYTFHERESIVRITIIKKATKEQQLSLIQAANSTVLTGTSYFINPFISPF